MTKSRVSSITILVACLVISLAAGIVGSRLIGPASGGSTSGGLAEQATSGTVYDRVIKTGVIRAAYLNYPPACMRDTKTGKMSGTFVETLERIASNCGLRVEWTEEVGWGSQIEGLMANRYDIVGSPVWANPNRGKLTSLSKPVYYSGIGVWVRSDDTRFDKGLGSANDPSVRIATIDGETADLIARTQFPNATRISSPQLTDISQKFLDVASGKADIVFTEPFFGSEYLKQNPGSVRNIAASDPIRVLGNCYMFKPGEVQFKHMIDTAIEDLLNSGAIDRIVDAYEPAPNTFYRVAKPYRSK